MTESVPPHQQFIEGVATSDVTIDSNSGHKVRIYLPEQIPTTNTKLPIILHFYGGGFCISQPDWYMYYHICTRLARLVPAICVSVYLRLAPGNRLPAGCDDGCAAFVWLRSLAKGESNKPWINDHADFNIVFLIGDSSGGNVVHEVAARGGNLGLSPLRLAGAIPINPGFVRVEWSKTELEQTESPSLTLDIVDKFFPLALPLRNTKDHPITCPVGSSALPIDGLDLLPFLLCVAEKDLMKDTEMEYYEAMKKGNKGVELLISHGMRHSFFMFPKSG